MRIKVLRGFGDYHIVYLFEVIHTKGLYQVLLYLKNTKNQFI